MGWATKAPSAPASSTILVPEIVVTARKKEEAHQKVPYSVHTQNLLDKKQIITPRTLPESLKDVPGVLVQKTAHGQGSPYIRGFTGYHTLMLIDGVRLNNSVYRAGPNQYSSTIDPNMLEKIEVVKGPGSVMYGSDAIGGVIQALSKSGQTWPKKYSGRASIQYVTPQDTKIFRGETSQSLSPNLSLWAGGTLKAYGDVRGGHDIGRQEHTGYSENDLDLKLKYNLRKKSILTIAYQKTQQDDVWRTHKTIFAETWEGTTAGSELRRSTDQMRELTYLKYESQSNGVVKQWQFQASYHRQSEEQFRVKSSLDSDVQGVAVNTLGLTANGQSPSDWGTWNYGMDSYQDNVNSYKYSYDSSGALTGISVQGPVADDSTYNQLGAYVENQYNFTSNLELATGLRWSQTKLHAGKFDDPISGESSLSEDWETIVGSLRAMWSISRRYHIFSGFSEGFRAPNLSDLTRLDTASSNEIETPSPNLRPEKFLNFDLGFRYSTRPNNFELGYFYTKISDLIIRKPTGVVISGDSEVTKTNSEKGYIHGLEASGQHQVAPHWSIRWGIAWLEGLVETYPTSAPIKKDEPLSRMMPLSGTLSALYRPTDQWSLVASIRTSSKQDRLSSRDQNDTQRIPPGGTPGYTVFDLKGRLILTKDLRVHGRVENIFNKDYRSHGSGQNESGTSLLAGLDWRF